MKKRNSVLVALALFTSAASAQAAAPTPDNYRGVIQGVMAKFDRDWQSLNPEGKPDPGALATLETFLQALDSFGISGPGQYHKYLADDGSMNSCVPGSANCQELKIEVRKSLHTADSTLFGAAQAFDYDIIVWSNEGSGFSRFLEGYFTQVPGTVGKGNLQVISCSGCSTVGHAQIEWDGTGTIYHLRSHMYDTRMDEHVNPQPYGEVIVDATYKPVSGDMKLAIAATNVCDSSGVGDSICSPSGTDDHSTGYSAILHANTISGNVYLSGLQGADNSAVAVSGADAMCIKADHTADLTNAACQADGIDNFNGISAYAPADTPASFVNADWLLPEVTDSPDF